MDKRIKTLGIIWVVLGSLTLVAGVLVGLGALGFILGGEYALTLRNPRDAPIFIVVSLVVIPACIFVLGALSIAAGRALPRGKRWARNTIVALSVIHLVNFPIGTIAGTYSLMVLISGMITPAPAQSSTKVAT